MLQGTKHINPIWDVLPEAKVDEFLRIWTHELDNWNAGSTDAIIESITRQRDTTEGQAFNQRLFLPILFRPGNPSP